MKIILSLLVLAMPLMSYTQSNTIKSKSIEFENRAWETYQAHKFEMAISLLDSSIQLDSSRPFPFIIKSEALWFIGRYAEAAETYKKWIDMKVADSSILLVGAHVHLGMLYDKANLEAEARKQYARAIDIFETGVYKPKRHFQIVEETEYVMAFGLLGITNEWKNKLNKLIEKYRLWDLRKLENIERKKLLEIRFAPFMLNGG